jgi:low temperature requirement protein LtrA
VSVVPEAQATLPVDLPNAPIDVEQRVTSLELFFDLVFAFAVTQVTGFVSVDPGWTRFVEGLAILAALWFAWSSYAWLGNRANTDEGLVRLILLAAMAAMLIASLSVPRAFGSDGLIFGVSYFVVRILHIACYAALARARNDPTLAEVVRRLASTILPAAALLVLAGALEGPARATCWVAALLVDYGAMLLRGVSGWRIEPGHFAERHGGFIIIALGESIVSLGVGAGKVALDTGRIVGALLGMATAGALWWAYFDLASIAAERELRRADPHRQVLMARDSYSYLHMPMVTGIVLFAIGVKQTLLHVTGHLHPVAAVSLCGGLALYLLALSAFKRRNLGSFNRPRVVAALLLACLTPLATAVPAILALAAATAIACGVIAFEFWRYAEARDHVRHGG